MSTTPNNGTCDYCLGVLKEENDSSEESWTRIKMIAMFLSGFVLGVILMGLVVFISRRKRLKSGKKTFKKQKENGEMPPVATYEFISDLPCMTHKRETISLRARMNTPEGTPVVVRKNMDRSRSLWRHINDQNLPNVPLPSSLYETAMVRNSSEPAMRTMCKSIYSYPTDVTSENVATKEARTYRMNPDNETTTKCKLSNTDNNFYFKLEKLDCATPTDIIESYCTEVSVRETSTDCSYQIGFTN